MGISAVIQEAIQKDLPNHVSSELKDYITKAQADGEELVELRAKFDKLEKEVVELRKLNLEAKQLEDLRKGLEKNDADLIHRKAMLDLEKELIQERLKDNKELVATVFRSNRLNYNVDVSVPVHDPNNPYCPEYRNVSGQVSKEE